MKKIVDYFVNLYQQSQNLSPSRKKLVQKDLLNLIAKLNLISQFSAQVDYRFSQLQQVKFENAFLAPKTLSKFRNYIDKTADQLINNFDDLRSYKIIILNLEENLLKMLSLEE